MLSTVAKLKAHLGIPAADTSKDTLLETLLKGSSAYIETETHRKLGLQEHDVKLDGPGGDMLTLPQYPVAEIATLEIDDQEVAEDNIDLDAEAGIVYLESGTFSQGRRNVHVVFSAGYVLPEDEESGLPPTLPDELENAAIRLAARVYERRTAEGVQSVSSNGFNASYKDAIDEDIQAVIGANTKLRT